MSVHRSSRDGNKWIDYQEIMLTAMIEDRKGIDVIDDILSVKRIDVVFFGLG